MNRKRRRNMSPTRKMPAARKMTQKQVAKKIIDALDDARTRMSRTKFYINMLEKMTGDEISMDEIITDIDTFTGLMEVYLEQ